MERLTKEQYYDSMRGWFAGELYNQMISNPDIIVLTGDLGFGLFDKIKKDFSNRFINCGASEQAMLGLAVGMTYRGKIPVVYSITSFLLSRGYEWLRNYIDWESAPVKLVGSGRGTDYKHDGFTHHSDDARSVLGNLGNIKQLWPEKKEDMIESVRELINNGKPTFMSLRRG